MTTSRGEATRERVLAVAESLVLERGFAGTSIDDIIEGAAGKDTRGVNTRSAT